MDYRQLLIPIVVSFLITAALTWIFIPMLRRLKAGQNILEDAPKSHMAKSGTPTMGGIAIILGVILTCVTAGGVNRDMVIILVAFVAFGALGFMDDFIKVVMHRNLGLTATQKLVLQIIIAAALALYQASVSVYGTSVFIPFIDEYWNFGIFYVPFVAFVVVAMVNSVNLTDGLDGLASGVTLIVALFLAIVGVTYTFTATSVFCAALAGGCLGFLMFNRHPAKVFMGDTGSLALGGGVAAAAILMDIEMIIPIAGGVYVAEALSVIIQVFSYKTRGKRVFKMAPLHHHFELCGWKEVKVVAVFWSVTLLLCILSMLILN